jgi:predicted nucleic acid-binding protein
MTEDELLALLSDGVEVVLAFDTNAIFGNHANDPFIQLCNAINRLNRIRDPRRIRKVIAAPVYMEKLHDLRQGHRNYDHQKIEQFLEDKQIDVMPFLEAHAEHVAGLLGELYPTPENWHEFKRQRCLSCLRLPDDLAHKAPGNGKHCGATIDWLVAGHADAEGHVLVTDDRGDEFERVQRKARLETVVKVVDEVLRATGAPP